MVIITRDFATYKHVGIESGISINPIIAPQRHVTVSLNIHNLTAVSYFNQKGETHSSELTQLTLELWNWCLYRDIYLVAHHVVGKSNVLADMESRVFQDGAG